LLLLPPLPAPAADALVRYATRPGVEVKVFRVPRPGATAALLLIPGGRGGLGSVAGGQPGSKNFLVRSRDLFAAAGFDVTIFGLPTDRSGLSAQDRLGPEHMQDLRAVARAIRTETGLPVWLVGTSMGTVSATAAALTLGPEELAGVVLTSSITSPAKTGAVTRQDLPAVRVPVLVLHHARDACSACVPSQAAGIAGELKNAPARRFVLAEGGGGVEGDPCEPLHYHGFMGMEREAVEIIAAFVRNPGP
jgi:pimeloyl-ACP methyl ester carboxylesterase